MANGIGTSARLWAALILAATLGAGITVAIAMGGGGSPNLSPAGISPADATKIVDPTKQAIWNEEYTRELTAVVATPLLVGSPYDPGRPTPLPVATGILPDGNPMGGMVFKNSWYGELNGQRVAVRAGLITADGTGVIAVEYSTPVDLRVYRAPAGSGALRLVNESDGVFQVAAASGDGFEFNLSELSLSARTPAVSTDTPEPASTSIAAP